MRSRSNSGVRLDLYQRIVNQTILKYQNPVTGLIRTTPQNSHSWVRDNVYSILAVWGLAMAYRKMADMDEDRAKAYELEKSVVKLMRGLLFAMMKQVDKLERFKRTQSRKDALHAKYDSRTGDTVVGDRDWGHLQIDATSLYILVLAQMTASGLHIIMTADEVDFVQNLVFYIEAAYRIPDYGIWERGDKTNHGLPELNASSIGMAKAAMEAIDELNLFGARGGHSSVIHVLADEAQQCQAILQSVLPRESNSKEVDAGLLSIISFPAFAVDDEELIDKTKQTIIQKLEGNYGCCRFLRDGYKTCKEDPNRLHYELWELKAFDRIECEWPLFLTYLILDGCFSGNQEQLEHYRKKLDDIMIRSDSGIPLVPELYSVPAEKVEAEYRHPKSQERKPLGMLPHMWGQSLYVLGRLLSEGFLSPGEVDPLNRRLVTEPKPDLIVQVVILAEDSNIQNKLAEHGLQVQTIAEAFPIHVYPARLLTHIYSLLGKNKKLGLSGRPSSEVGLIATSKLYRFKNETYAFFPQFTDSESFYLTLDSALFVDNIRTDVDYIRCSWTMPGRPLLVLPICTYTMRSLDEHAFYLSLDTEFMLDMFRTDVGYLHDNWQRVGRPTMTIPITHRLLVDSSSDPPLSLLALMQKVKGGYLSGARVELGNLSDFVSTSCVTELTFLEQNTEETAELLKQMEQFVGVTTSYRLAPSFNGEPSVIDNTRRRRQSQPGAIQGIIKRTRSIQIEPGQLQGIAMRQRCGSGRSISPSDDHSPEISPLHFDEQKPTKPALLHLLSSDVTDGIHRVQSDLMWHPDQYKDVSFSDLIEVLRDSHNLQEQADIIHYLFVKKGPNWDTNMDGRPGCTVLDLLNELYDKAGHLKQWWLVRHTAGMLKKRVEDLAKATTDIVVRQKQLSVGLPPEPREKIITRPLPPDELAAMIHSSCGEDVAMAMLTQELLVYLAMFVRTEPKLFTEMLRIRVGLIIQVMATEMARTLNCSGEEASDHLLNLSPFEMKTLLHHILSGKEFGITRDFESLFMTPGEMITRAQRNKSVVTSSDMRPTEEKESDGNDERGQWLRRRRLDGALNRVPVGFYQALWKTLERCQGISVDGHTLPQSLIKEMTREEFKFALQVEMVMNRIPEPEYRQLMVEAMMVLTMLAEHDNGKADMNWVIPVDKIVRDANELFLADQAKFNGDATLCCATPHNVTRSDPLLCFGAKGLCQNFYDSAPSGRYGTMTYLFRAVASAVQFPCSDGENITCAVS